MDFNWDVALKAVGVLLPVIVPLVLASLRTSPLDRRLDHDVERVAKLPESEARTLILERIRRTVEAQSAEPEGRRDTPMLVVSVILTGALGWLTVWLVANGAWWSYTLAAVAALLCLLFVYGIFETAQKVPRDEKGRRIKM
nr:hypothetical protein [Sphaerisporangium cinnabarinum]